MKSSAIVKLVQLKQGEGVRHKKDCRHYEYCSIPMNECNCGCYEDIFFTKGYEEGQRETTEFLKELQELMKVHPTMDQSKIDYILNMISKQLENK